jgi:hypothetical protein
MPFEIIKAAAADAAAIISDRDLNLAEDGKTILEARDPKSATVLVGAGGTIPGPTVARLGLELVDGKVVQRQAVEKQREPAEDKSRRPEENKGGGKPPKGGAETK